jgi:hypothetical protein
VVTQVATRDCFDLALSIAVTLFALTLPILLLFWLQTPVESVQLEAPGDVVGMESFLLVIILNLSGFTALFFHFGLIHASLFLVSTAIAVWALCSQAQFSFAHFRDLVSRYPSLPKRLFRVAFHRPRTQPQDNND